MAARAVSVQAIHPRGFGGRIGISPKLAGRAVHPKDWSGPYGISGHLPREMIVGIAAAMDAGRLAARG